MKKLISILATVVFALLSVTQSVLAQTCGDKKDFKNYVSGKEQCLVIGAYGNQHPKTLVVWLHGDIPPSMTAQHVLQLAENRSKDLAFKDVLSIGMLRPGCRDALGRRSSAGFLDNGCWNDTYSQNNVTEVAFAVNALKKQYGAERVILVGQSGGSAIAAILLDMFPQVANAAVLAACPCDLDNWVSYRGFRPWSSEDPIKHTRELNKEVKVIAMTKVGDPNTKPIFSQNYIAALLKNGINAEFRMLSGNDHSTMNTNEVFKTVVEVLN